MTGPKGKGGLAVCLLAVLTGISSWASPPAGMKPEGALTLPQAIQFALANNPEVAAAGWDARAAQAQYDQTIWEIVPSLKSSGGYARYLDPQRLLPARSPTDPGIWSRDIVSGDLVLTLPLFTGGRLIAQTGAANLLQQAAEHRLARSRGELVFNVSSLFFAILAQQELVKSLAGSQAALEAHLKAVDALIAAQKAARIDRLRTEVRLADIRQRLVKENNVKAIQYRALANLLGTAGAADTLTLEGELESEADEPAPSLGDALTQARTMRDDYQAAQLAAKAQAQSVATAAAGHWPNLILQATYGERWAAGATSGSPLASTLEDAGRVGVALDFPLLDQGRVAARVREQQARLAAARQRLRKFELQVQTEVEAALLNITSARERVAVTQKSVEQAEEGLRIERQKYELGKGVTSDVLDAQAAFLDAQTSYYRAWADLRTARAQLQLAIGEEP
jgi:outer membrane protein TolC